MKGEPRNEREHPPTYAPNAPTAERAWSFPAWTIPVALLAVVLILVAALVACGDGSDAGDHASEVQGAHTLLAEESKWLDYGAEGLELVEQGRQECREAAYLCDSVAAINEETGTAKMEKSTEQVEQIRSTLGTLDPAAVEEAGGR